MNGFETILPFLKPIGHLLLDDSISEVMINGADCVFIEKQGFLEPVTGVSLGDSKERKMHESQERAESKSARR